MFLSAFSLAEDVRKEAEIMVAKKKALERQSVHTASFSDDGISDESTASSLVSAPAPKTRALADPKGPWTIKKNSILRADAVKTIENEIVSTKNLFSRTRERCVDTAKVAVMRFENGSAQGAKMGLKKLSSRAKELGMLESRCYKLLKYRDLIETHSCSPEKFVPFLNKTMEEKDQSSSSASPISTIPSSESDLEVHLKKGTLINLFTEADMSDIVLDVERNPRT
jgi:hypothetical protein